MAKRKTSMTTARTPSKPNAFSIVMFHRTSESWACASESAQSRRYEAVLEMQPRQNSIVSVRIEQGDSAVSAAAQAEHAQRSERERTDDLVDDDLSQIVSLLLRLLRHSHRMALMRSLPIRIRLVVRRMRAVLAILDPVVPLLLDLVHLAVFEVGARAEHPGDADEREEEEKDLDEGLAAVELVVWVDLCVKKAWDNAKRGRSATLPFDVRRDSPRTFPGLRNIWMSMFSRLGGLRPAASQSTDHL